MRVLGVLLSVLISSIGFAEETDLRTFLSEQENHPLVQTLSITSGGFYVASSIEDDIRDKIPKDEKIKVNTSVPVHFKYALTFRDPHIRNYYPGGYQGLGVSLLNLGALQGRGISKSTRYIGYPVTTYIYQGAPFWKIKKGLALEYEWNFGASFGWKPYNDENQYFNLTVGSRVNAYLALNFNLRWKITENLSLIGGLGVAHYSNGNTSYPNPGINLFGLNIGVSWILNPQKGEYPKEEPDTLKKRKIEYDILLWGASRKRVYRGGEEPVLLPGHFACAGVSFAPMVRLNTWWRVGGSLDLQWDRSSDLKKNYIEGTTTDDIKFNTPNFWRQVSLGISAHGELQMPVFAVNIGIGYNFITPYENRGCYQNIALKTYVCKNLFLNVGYQLRNFYQQSSLMLGVGATI